MLTEQQFTDAAALLGCEVACIKAVNQVEASGSGFRKDGRPKILFEGHVFWKQLQALGMNPQQLQPGNEDILYPKYFSPNPYYKMDQYLRLDKARIINADAADQSASWGAFQIMGGNYKACGYSSVDDFVKAQADEYN